VLGVDLVRPVLHAGVVVPGRYQMADLTDTGSAYSVVSGAGAVVHTAAIPQPMSSLCTVEGRIEIARGSDRRTAASDALAGHVHESA
jgi:hypothetical protein